MPTWVLIAAVSGLALAAAPAASGRSQEPQWSAQKVLGEVRDFAAGQGSRSQLVGDAKGDVALAWLSSDGLRLTRSSHGGPLGPGRLISRHIDSAPFMAIDGRGDVVVAWSYSDHTVSIPGYMDEVECCDHVRVAMLRAGSKHVTFTDLTRPLESASVRSVALTSDGSTVAVAYEAEPESVAVENGQETRLFVSVGSFSRSFRHKVSIGNTMLFSLRAVAHSMSLVTGGLDGGAGGYLRETVVSAAGRMSEVRRVTGSFASFRSRENPEGEDTAGDLATLVEENAPDGITYDLATLSGRHATLRSQLLAFEGTDASRSIFDSPAIAVAPSGRMLASWEGYAVGDRNSLVIAAGSVGDGRLRTVGKLLSAGSEGAYRGSVDAVDSAGVGVVVAEQGAPSSRYQQGGPLVAVFFGPRGRISSLVPIGRVEDIATWSGLSAVIDKHGHGIVAWQDGSGQLLTRRFRAP